jgi:hypothetical protein
MILVLIDGLFYSNLCVITTGRNGGIMGEKMAGQI